MSLLSLALLASNLYQVVHPFCNHTALPNETSTNPKEVELLLNCSSSNLTVTTIFNIPRDLLLEYTILYTCTGNDLPKPIQRYAIDGAMINMTKRLHQEIPCNSLCTFGGCYSSGPLGKVINLSISPLQSCFVCPGDDNGVCTAGFDQCIPSVNLGNGSVHCNCSIDDHPSSAVVSPVTTAMNIAEDNCEYAGHIKRCFCNETTGYNCTTSMKSNPLIIITSVLIASLLCCIILCFLLILCSTLYKNSKKRKTRPAIVDSTVFDKIFSFDPVDMDVPKYQEKRSESLSTLLHTIDVLSAVKFKQSTNVSSSSNPTGSCVDSECHLSDVEGYITCGDCPCSSASDIEICHHCQAVHNKDEQQT